MPVMDALPWWTSSRVLGVNLTSLVAVPLAIGLLLSPLARGIPADVPVFFFIGLDGEVG